MSFLDSIVTVNITATSATLTRPNFGTPLIMAYHLHNTDRVRTYTSLSDMVTDGFSTTEPAYYMATAIVSQNPRPPSFKVGRLTQAVQEAFTFTVPSLSNGDIVGLTITDPTGTATSCYVTATTGMTASSAATSIAAKITAIGTITATAVTSVITGIGTTNGQIFYPSNMLLGSYANVTTTLAPGTDLDALLLVDSDWYGVSQSVLSQVNISLTAAWAEANKKLHAYTTADDANKTAASGVMASLKTAGYKRSYGQYGGAPAQYGATALMAQRFTADPGTDTWAFKNLSNVNADPLTPTNRTGITTNNGNYYINIGGVNASFDGRSAQGQFMDLQRFLDALQADIQLRVATLLVNSERVPYTQPGIASVGAEISASLQSFVRTGALSNDPGYQPAVFVPKISTVSTSNKQNRILSNVTFTCTYAGAIHSVTINGTVTI